MWFQSSSNQATSDDIIPDSLLEPQCAWCMTERGEDLGEGSHGICREHADEMLRQHHQSLEERRAGH